MRNVCRWLACSFVVANLLVLVHFAWVEMALKSDVGAAVTRMRRVQEERGRLLGELANVSREHVALSGSANVGFQQVRTLMEESRRNIIRIRNIPEKNSENLVEKVSCL